MVMPIKFALCGKAGPGKDLVFAMIKAILNKKLNKSHNKIDLEYILQMAKTNEDWLSIELGFINERFANPIKHTIAGFLGCPLEVLQNQEIKKQTLPSAYFTANKTKITIREMHQIIGDAMKDAFNMDIFALSLIERCNKQDTNNIAVLDLRFPNEAAVLRNNGFTIIKIFNETNPVDAGLHNSEILIDQIEYDYYLRNDGKSLIKLFARVTYMCYCLGWIDDKTYIELNNTYTELREEYD